MGDQPVTKAKFDGLYTAAKAMLDQMVALTAKIDNINNNNNRNNRNRRCGPIRVHDGNNRIFTQIPPSVSTRREPSISKPSKVPTKHSEISTISSKSASLSVPHIIIERDKAERIKGAKLELKNSIDSDVRMDDVGKLFTASCEASNLQKPQSTAILMEYFLFLKRQISQHLNLTT